VSDLSLKKYIVQDIYMGLLIRYRNSPPFMEPEGSLACSQVSTARCTLSWARWIQSTLIHPIYLRSILILLSHVRPSLQSGLFPLSFQTKILCICYLLLIFIYFFSPSHSPRLLRHPPCLLPPIAYSGYSLQPSICRSRLLHLQPQDLPP